MEVAVVEVVWMAAGRTEKTQQKGGEISRKRSVGLVAGFPLEAPEGESVRYGEKSKSQILGCGSLGE